jgi:hypothetical protein
VAPDQRCIWHLPTGQTVPHFRSAGATRARAPQPGPGARPRCAPVRASTRPESAPPRARAARAGTPLPQRAAHTPAQRRLCARAQRPAPRNTAVVARGGGSRAQAACAAHTEADRTRDGSPPACAPPKRAVLTPHRASAQARAGAMAARSVLALWALLACAVRAASACGTCTGSCGKGVSSYEWCYTTSGCGYSGYTGRWCVARGARHGLGSRTHFLY